MTDPRTCEGRRDSPSARIASALSVAAARVALLILSLVATAACGGGAVAATTTSPPDTTKPAPVTWTLVWSDEFDGPAGAPVDTTKWAFDLGDGCPGLCGWGNKEKEYYTNAPDNVSLDGQGHLAIVARPAVLNVSCYYGPCRYTSAKITTRGKFAAAPGKVEARIRIPAGQGLWPAFWMLGNDLATVGWPASGEIDIMENKGSTPNASSSALHGPGYFGNTPFSHTNFLPAPFNLTDDLHVYSVEWDASHALFYAEPTIHYSVSRSALQSYGPSILDKPYFVILNLAVGGNFDGDPKSDAILPATMLVDYVRVYTRSK
jgi:beta-glucanase (GH16 family)